MVNDMTLGVICEIQKYAISDGPGIRTVVFIKGCPLMCKWCSNPETQNPFPEIYYNKEKCVFCQRCVSACGVQAIRSDVDKKLVVTDRSKCKACGKCVAVCPAEARSLVGVYMTPEELVEEIKKDMIFYESSEGGVTLSGGEIFYSYEFALEVLKKCKEEFIDTAIETSGYVQWNIMEEMLPYVDHVLIDIKHMDPARHMYWTGVSNELILGNIEKIDATGKDYVIRVPLIPGVNDDDENLERLKGFAQKLMNLHEIHLLPYHTLGRSKYMYLERDYELNELKKHTTDEIKRIAALLETSGVRVIIGG